MKTLRKVSIIDNPDAFYEEKIKELMLKVGAQESELSQARGPKQKEDKESKSKHSVYTRTEKTAVVPTEKSEQSVTSVMDDEVIPRAIDGDEENVEIYEPVIHKYRSIEQILADGAENEREMERLERHKLIPEPVKELCKVENDRLIREIMRLEKRYDQIADYLNGEEVC